MPDSASGGIKVCPLQMAVVIFKYWHLNFVHMIDISTFKHVFYPLNYMHMPRL